MYKLDYRDEQDKKTSIVFDHIVPTVSSNARDFTLHVNHFGHYVETDLFLPEFAWLVRLVAGPVLVVSAVCRIDNVTGSNVEDLTVRDSPALILTTDQPLTKLGLERVSVIEGVDCIKNMPLVKLTLDAVLPEPAFLSLFTPDSFPQLRELELTLSHLPRHWPRSLTTLHVHGLDTIENIAALSELQHLTWLDLSRNNLRRLGPIAQIILKLPLLTHLQLDGNNFPLTELVYLLSQKNQLTSLSACEGVGPVPEDLFLTALRMNTTLMKLDLFPLVLGPRLELRLKANCQLPISGPLRRRTSVELVHGELAVTVGRYFKQT